MGWSLRSRAINTLHRLTPPALFDAALTLAGRAVHPGEPYRSAAYHGVRTHHNARPLHVGRFAEIYERHQPLDPHIGIEVTRYRIYNACVFAQASAGVPGDFLSAGISYGVAPRVIYDFVNFETLGKTLHLVDPFIAAGDASAKRAWTIYNTDPQYVRRQYPAAAHVLLHLELIPAALPLRGVDRLAFVHLNTGNADAEAEALPILYRQLSSGGAIVIDRYAAGDGQFAQYDPAIAALGAEPIWFPSGQCVLLKR